MKRRTLLLEQTSGAGHLNATPLMHAALCGSLEIVLFLLDNGADPNMIKGEEVTALKIAACTDTKGMVQLLLERGAKTTVEGGGGGHEDCKPALRSAAEWGRLDNALAILDKGAPVDDHGANVGDYVGSALMGASKFGHVKIVQELILRGADLEIVCNVSPLLSFSPLAYSELCGEQSRPGL